MEKENIKFAEKIAYEVNVYLYSNEPEFKDICDIHLNNYLYLERAETNISEDLKKLNSLIRNRIYQDTLREVLPAVHPYGKNPFFYFNEGYLLRESEIDALIKKIRENILPVHKPFFKKYIKSSQQLKKWYEKQLCKKTYDYIDICYKHFC